MAGVRRFGDMLQKYTAKYSGTNVTTALTAVKEIMDSRFEAAVSPITSVLETVRSILESNGVPAGFHGLYYAFAQELVRLTFSHSDETLNLLISGKKAYYSTALGADTTILDKIVLAVLGSVPPY